MHISFLKTYKEKVQSKYTSYNPDKNKNVVYVQACNPRRLSTLSPSCRPLGQSATQRCAHSSRLREENSTALL